MYTGITECKRSEEAVQESERVHAFQSEILEAVQDPILAVGPDFKIVYWNDAAVRTFGWTADEVLGCHVTEVLKTTVPDSLREEILGQMFATGEYRGEAVYCRKDGHQVPMEVNSRVVRGADGKVLRVVTILRDITERRRIEQRLEILAEANALLLQSDDPEAVVQYIAEKVMANLQADVFFNYMLDSGEDRLRLNACGGVSKRTAKLIERLELGQAICGCVARDGERIISEDVQNNGDPRADLVRRMGVQCYVCHPLKVGNETIGTLSFGTKRTTCFSADEIELMRTVANQVSIAMERMRAEQAQRQAEQLAMRASLVSATLARVNEILLAARTVDDVLTRLVNDVSIEAGADRCLIIEVRGDMYTAARIRGVREDLIDQERPSSCFCAVALAVQERRPVLIDDAWTDPRTNKDFVHSYDLRAFELLPIIEGDRVTHVLALVFDSPQEFNELDAEAAERISVAMTVAMGNAKLYEREHLRRKRVEALHKVLEAGISSLDVRGAAQQALDNFSAHSDFDRSSLWLADGDEFELVADVGYPDSYREFSPFTLAGSRNRAKALTADRTIAEHAVDASLAAMEAKLGLTLDSHMVLPILSRDGPIGVLSLAWSEPRELNEGDREFYHSVSDEIAVVLDNARLYSIECERLRLTEGIAEIESVVHSSLSFDEVVALALTTGAQLLGANTGAISLREDGFFIVEHAIGFPSDIVGTVIDDEPEQHSLLALRTKEPVVIEDVNTDERVDLAHMSAFGVAAVVVVPLIVYGEAIGCMYFNFAEPRRFSSAEVRFARQLSSSLSLAMENARLYERERRARRVNEALSAIDQEIYSTLDRREVLVRVGPLAAEALGADGALLWVQDGDDWSVLYVHEAPVDLIGSAFPAAELPLITAAIEGGAPIAIEDVMIDARANPFLRAKIGLKSVLLTPVFVAGRPVAVVFFVYRTQRSFSDEEVAWVSRLASSLGLAMANAELYQSERRIAETLQETLVVLPHRVPGVEFSHAYKAATHELGRVGGDFVDLFEVRRDFIGIVIGDVAGSGIDAAVITSLVRNTIRAYAIDGLSPSAAVEKSNNVMKRFTDLDAYVTLFFGMLSTRTGLFHYVSAGHPPALVLSSRAAIEELAGRNPIMGAFENTKFHEAQTVLAPGDRLVLYTDGVTEARAPDAGGFLGVGGFEQLLQIHTGQATRKLADTLMKDVVEFSKGVLRDDAAILVVEPTNFALPGEGHLRLALG